VITYDADGRRRITFKGTKPTSSRRLTIIVPPPRGVAHRGIKTNPSLDEGLPRESGAAIMFTSRNALSMLNKWKGRHRAAFWRPLGFPNCARARAAWKRQRHQLLVELWRREERQRTPFAIDNEPPPSYQELAARFTVPYGRRLAELRAQTRRKRGG
jgi:hypothetical protein